MLKVSSSRRETRREGESVEGRLTQPFHAPACAGRTACYDILKLQTSHRLLQCLFGIVFTIMVRVSSSTGIHAACVPEHPLLFYAYGHRESATIDGTGRL